MDSNILKKIAGEHKELLSLPQSLAEVLRLVRDERSGADDLAAVLIRDPALTARILRIVNSAYYGGGRQVGTMSQAVMTIGMRQITALTLSASVYKLTDDWQSSIDRLRFWRHSLDVAIGSRMIAEKIGYARPEEAFVAGLLHDLGILILDHSFPKEYSRVWKGAGWSGNLIDCEEEVWCTNHAKVAQFLLDQWQLPESICQAVGSHHIVFVRGTNEPELVLNQIICLANHMSCFTVADHPTTDAGLDRENQEILIDNLRLSREQVLEIEKNLFSQTVAEAKFLEMNIGSVDDILLEANHLLFEKYLAVENLLKDNRQMQQHIVRDQIERVSLTSIKSATETVARCLSGAATKIEHKAQEIRVQIEKEGNWDSKETLSKSIDAVQRGVEVLRSLVGELNGISLVETGSLTKEGRLADISTKIWEQVQSIDEPVETG